MAVRQSINDNYTGAYFTHVRTNWRKCHASGAFCEYLKIYNSETKPQS